MHDAAERALEVLDRAHRDRVDHLLAELRAAVGRRQAVLREHLGSVEVDRRMERRAAFVLVDDEDVLADGPASSSSHGIRSVVSFMTAVSKRAVMPGSTANTRRFRKTGRGIDCRSTGM